MTARRLALAWCWGSVCGLAVGWVYGSAVRDLAAFRALRRAEPGPGAPQEGARRLFTLDEVAAAFGVDLCSDRFEHPACSGDAWDDAADELTACACPCHQETP